MSAEPPPSGSEHLLENFRTEKLVSRSFTQRHMTLQGVDSAKEVEESVAVTERGTNEP